MPLTVPTYPTVIAATTAAVTITLPDRRGMHANWQFSTSMASADYRFCFVMTMSTLFESNINYCSKNFPLVNKAFIRWSLKKYLANIEFCFLCYRTKCKNCSETKNSIQTEILRPDIRLVVTQNVVEKSQKLSRENGNHLWDRASLCAVGRMRGTLIFMKTTFRETILMLTIHPPTWRCYSNNSFNKNPTWSLLLCICCSLS